MRVTKKVFGVALIFLVFNGIAAAQKSQWKRLIQTENDIWYASDEAAHIAENVLLYQRDCGGWPKNIEMQQVLTDAEKQKLKTQKADPDGSTTDNGATTQEMLFLSKVYKQKPNEKYKTAFLKGLDYLLRSQYDNGGWPQFYPLKKGYYSHITYNDDAMVNVLTLLKEIGDNSGYYSIVPPDNIKDKASTAFDKGIECILKTQYRQNGVLTAWCAQHDEVTLLPAKARAYELPSLSGKESAKIILLLMSVKNPSEQIITAVDAAVTWFEKTKIEGIAIESFVTVDGKKDRHVVQKPGTEPLWARFMELDNNKPFFCDRDGIKKATIAEIGYERRNGYAWYTNEPKEVLKKYQKWKNSLK